MRCDTVRENLGLFLDRELHSEIAHQIESHLRDCERCRRLVARFRQVGDLLGSLEIPGLPSGFSARTVARANALVDLGRAAIVRLAENSPVETGTPSVISRGGNFRNWSNMTAAAVFLVGLAIGGLMCASVWEFPFETAMENNGDSGTMADLSNSNGVGDYASTAENELMIESYLALLDPVEGQEY